MKTDIIPQGWKLARCSETSHRAVYVVRGKAAVCSETRDKKSRPQQWEYLVNNHAGEVNHLILRTGVRSRRISCN